MSTRRAYRRWLDLASAGAVRHRRQHPQCYACRVPQSEDIQRFLAGDRESVRRIEQWIRGTLLGYRDKLAHEIDDLQQEILAQLIEAFHDGRFRGQSRLKTYVKSFAHHKAIDRLRSLHRRSWTDLDEIDTPVDEVSVFDRLAREQQVEIALRVASRMSEQCRELWQMLGRGMSYREMSREVGVAAGTLRARVMQSSEKLSQ